MSSALATVIVGILTFMGSLIGTYSGIKLMSYRIEQLEKQVEKHNHLIERMYKVEETTAILTNDMKVANHRIEDLERHEEKGA